MRDQHLRTKFVFWFAVLGIVGFGLSIKAHQEADRAARKSEFMAVCMKYEQDYRCRQMWSARP